MGNICVLLEIWVAESAGDKIATGSSIDLPTTHAQILLSQKPPKPVSHVGNDSVFIGNWLR